MLRLTLPRPGESRVLASEAATHVNSPVQTGVVSRQVVCNPAWSPCKPLSF